MVKVSIEVRNGAACFRVAIWAENIQRALSLVGRRYSGDDLRVKFPIDLEGSFVNDPATPAGIASAEQSRTMAA